MAEVWGGRDEVLGRPIAVKVVNPEQRSKPAFHRRFREEARAAARLCHPRIVTVYDFGEVEAWNGSRMPYIVMEHLDGETLSERLGRGALPLVEALRTCAQIAEALTAAHTSGLVHHDVKPTNVFLTPHGVKVIDFGIARATRDETRLWFDSAMPTEPLLMGTPGYLAPEQLGPSTATPAVDVYALGVVLTECLTGRRALDAPLPPGIPDEVAELCSRARADDPRIRPSAAEAARILNRAVLVAEGVGERGGAFRPTGRRPFRVVAATAPVADEPPDPGPVGGRGGDVGGTDSSEPHSRARDSHAPDSREQDSQDRDSRERDLRDRESDDRTSTGGGRGRGSSGRRHSAGRHRRLPLSTAVTAGALGLAAGAAMIAAGTFTLGSVSSADGSVPPPAVRPVTSPGGDRMLPPAGGSGDVGAPATAAPPEADPVLASPEGPYVRRETLTALTSMRPIVDEGFAAGEIRPDVAIDINNVVTNLHNELIAGQQVDLPRRLGELHDKIATRLREGGLTQGRAQKLSAALAGVS
jgi:serine/threonine protein kinase